MNAITIVAAEQQTMNYYMNVGNRPENPLARGLYLEIAQIEEQHVSHYETIMDPSLSWYTQWVLHEYNECWLYWSWLQTEVDPRVKALWELHLNMELEHLRLACDTLKEVEGRDASEFLPAQGMPDPLTFEQNKQYVRDVLATTVDWTAFDARFMPIDDLPKDHRFFAYQHAVNQGGVPTEEVIDQHRTAFGAEYRRAAAPHPIESLREESGQSDRFSYWQATVSSEAGAAE